MTCAQCRRLLSRYHDAALASAESAAVREHLAGCPACSAQLAGYQQIDGRLTRALRTQPRPGFRDAVLAATSDRVVTFPASSQASRIFNGHGRLLLGSLTGACVALLLVLSLAIASGLSPRRPMRATAANDSSSAATSAPGHRSTWPVLAFAGTPASGESPTHATAIIPPPIHRQPGLRGGNPVVAAWRSPTPVANDRAAGVRIAREATLVTGAVRGPLWSHDSVSLLYLIGFAVDPRTGWWTGTLMRYSSARAGDPNASTHAAAATVTAANPVRSVRLATGVRNYAWSDDDLYIAYTTQTAPGSSDDAPQQLHLVASDGSNDHLLCGVDRANILFLDHQIIAVRHGIIVSVDPATGQATPFFSTPPVTIADEETAFYALSAGGRFLAYQDHTGLRVWGPITRATPASGIGDGTSALLDAHHLAPTVRPALLLRIPLARYLEASFHFSWDGSLLFYSTFDGHYTKLYRQALPTGIGSADPPSEAIALNNQLPLHGPIDLVGSPSPDSAIATFRIGTGALARNYIIDTRHGLAHPLLPPEGVGPVGYWSPDGRHLVYTVFRGDVALYSAIARVL